MMILELLRERTLEHLPAAPVAEEKKPKQNLWHSNP